jgi:Na+/H+ antiporter NhaA
VSSAAVAKIGVLIGSLLSAALGAAIILVRPASAARTEVTRP